MPDPILPGRPGLYLSMLTYGLRNTDNFAVEHAAFHRAFREYAGDVAGKCILDLGCGETFWLSLLLASDGADVLGVDTEVTEPRRSPGKYWQLLRTNGLESATCAQYSARRGAGSSPTAVHTRTCITTPVCKAATTLPGSTPTPHPHAKSCRATTCALAATPISRPSSTKCARTNIER